MKVEFVSSEAAELHRYLQTLIDRWPGSADAWTAEQHRVSRAFLQLEWALQRDELPPSESGGNENG